MKQAEQGVAMPLVRAMLEYKNEDIYPLHTPGHKGGRGMQRLLRQELGAAVAMDVSLMSELDDIHEPETYIKEAQRLAAKAYGSDACFWAVNGTSQAIHAMLLTALNPGEKLLLPRNAHRSVAGGLVLGGLWRSICSRNLMRILACRCRLRRRRWSRRWCGMLILRQCCSLVQIITA